MYIFDFNIIKYYDYNLNLSIFFMNKKLLYLINIYLIIHDLIKIENFIMLYNFILLYSFVIKNIYHFFNINKFSNNETYYEMYKNL